MIKLIFNFLSFTILFNFLKLFMSRSVKRKTEKYDKQFRPLVKCLSISFIIFAILVLLYFFPKVLYSKYGFLEVNEETLKDILQIGFTIAGVVFGVFLQQLLEFLIVPDKEVLYPLEGTTIITEFLSTIEEFADKLKKDEKKLLDNKETKIFILLSSPVLIDFDEVSKIIKNKDHQTRWEKSMYDIFSDKDDNYFEKELICLSPLRSQGISPLQRFIKTFSGYIISESDKDIKGEDDFFYEKVDTFRKHITSKISKFCDRDSIKKYIKFAKEDDLQWQAIVIQAPQIRFYKAVVGFYGEDFFKKNSRLDLMSSLKSYFKNTDAKNQGFLSDEPDIVEWVMKGLINPYIPDIPDEKQRVEFVPHHSSIVHNKITQKNLQKKGNEEEVLMVDNLKTLETVKVLYEYGPDSIIKEMGYPVYDGTKSSINIRYCQYLFHPLIAESATWSSLNIRMPGNNSGKVLDMCCGIGVQGLAAIDKGATFVHGVDIDPISLLCTIENYKRKITDKAKIQVFVTLSDGFSNIKAENFEAFEKAFKETINNSTWKGILNKQKEKLMKLFEDNRSYAKEIYKGNIEKDFDLIILEPPFVEFSEDEISPSHDSLYDKHFRITRGLLKNAKEYLKKSGVEDKKDEDWEKPYVMQSFSSLENIIEFEDYIEKVVEYKIFRKSCIEKNGVYWYYYHLIPIID